MMQDTGSRSDTGTSRSMLDDARRADSVAWERLVRLYSPLVASWCRRWGLAEQDILDVLQEVFSSVAANLKRFRKDRPTDTFRGWLLTIARNKVLDQYRRAEHQVAAAGGTDALVRLQQVQAPVSDAELPDPADDQEFNQVLLRALDAIRGEFHERTWQSFWGVVVEGRATADVAADLAMTPGAIRVAKSRVLLRLRRELGDAEG
ncbi:MAG: sigma-70 family RNA polymerase sigma factor [Planctomycetaceae bacterium]|nr:sigma-70 family RNA polymerase sigma factor [Planctomycetaceae bacterium]